MDADEFDAGYPRNMALSAYREDPLLPECYTEGRRWLDRYSHLLHDRLNGKSISSVEMVRFSQGYVRWHNYWFVPGVEQHLQRISATISNALEVTASTERIVRQISAVTGRQPPGPRVEPLDEDLLTERHFITSMFEPRQHAQMIFTQQMWGAALAGTPLRRPAVTKAAILAACSGTDLWTSRDIVDDENLYFDKGNTAHRSVTTGVLAELDLLVLLLTISQQRPHLIPLPAPPDFEQWAPGRNVDFIVLDLNSERAIGLQCKASAAGTQDLRVDPDRVIVVDTSHDLFDALAKRTFALKSDTRVVAWPGMVSAHYLMSVKVPRPPWPWLDEKLLYRSKILSRRLAHQARDRNEEARVELEDRILTALGYY